MKSIDIPKTIESKDLEHAVCKIFNSFDFDLGEDSAGICHRFIKSKHNVVKFSQEKDCCHIYFNTY